MRALVTIATLLLAPAILQAGEVYKTTDPQGRPIYTDKPPTLPAERLDVKSSTTDVVEVQKRYDEQMQRYAETDEAGAEASAKAAEVKKAKTLTAEDRAKRCEESRKRYESYMNAQRLYEQGKTESERRYLTDSEIDAARTNAKRVMDEFCGGQ